VAELFLLVIMLAAFSSTVGVWYVATTLKAGFNEHIKALQAIYEETAKLNGRQNS
jgi:hypothetical protein